MVVQVALSLVLVVGALLFVRSLRNLMILDAGFRQDGVLVVNLDVRGANIPPQGRRDAFNALASRLAACPVWTPPPRRSSFRSAVRVEQPHRDRRDDAAAVS